MEQDFYKVEIKIRKLMDSEKARHALEQAVYDATIIFYETIGEGGLLTDGKRLVGNGHHMAQEMVMKASNLWNERLK